MYCRQCGIQQVSDDDKFCRACGAPLDSKTIIVATPVEVHPQEMPLPYRKKFNWGAFLMSSIWAIGNMGVWRGIFIFLGISVVSFALSNIFDDIFFGYSIFDLIFILAIGVIFGIYGNRWAWKWGPQRDSLLILKESKKCGGLCA